MGSSIVGQNLLKSRTSSYHTRIYKLTEKEAENIYGDKRWSIDTTYFHTLIDTYPTDSSYKKQLPPGHYLRTFIRKDKLKLDITSVQSYYVEILNNSSDLQIKVFDKSGGIIEIAKVKIRNRTIGFDKKTQTYRIKQANRRGLLKIAYDGETAFYNLSKSYNNSRAKRVFNKTVYGTPLRYFWRPVNFVVKIPIDGVKSISRRYAYGTISATAQFFSRIYHSVACLFDDYYCASSDSYRFERRYMGYLAFSQPKYLPGDTVKLKAFITNRRGKPLNRMVEVALQKSYDNIIKLTELLPYQKGGYSYEFPIHDTLDLTLDKSYRIKLQKREFKVYISKYFKYEEYELSKNRLELNAPKKKFYLGDTVFVDVSGKDENDLNLLDGELEILVRPKTITSYFDDQVFASDTLHYLKIPLEPSRETRVKFPSSVFPKINLDFNVDVTLRTSDNERMVEQETLEYSHELREISYDLRGDSIHIDYLLNGRSSARRGLIYGSDAFGNGVDTLNAEFPYTVLINPYYHKYNVEVLETKRSFSIHKEPALLTFQSTRSSDSLEIRSTNPRNLSFNYSLYKANNEIDRGFIDTLVVQKKISTSQSFHLSVQYLWGGRVHEENYEVPFLRDQLQLELDAPPVIYPGQEVEIEVSVRDANGKPVPDTDVLVHGLTKKFESNPVGLPRLAKGPRDRQLINTFRLSRDPFFQKERSYDFNYWNPLHVLDSIAYFQFLYPGNNVYKFEYSPRGGATQFSPFVIKKGVIQPVSIVYVDRQPVYFSWSANSAYSFRVSSGYHKIEIRTRDKLFVLDSMLFSSGKKQIFSIDEENLPPNVRSYDRSPQLTDYEKKNLIRYTVPFRNTFRNKYGYFRQGTNFFPVFQNADKFLAGPMSSRLAQFRLIDGFEHHFTPENNFEYEFREGLIKMRSVDLTDRIRTSGVSVERFSDEVWNRRMIEGRWREEIARRRKSARKYANPTTTQYGRAKLLLDLNSGENLRVSNTLLFKLNDADFLRVYPSLNSYFHDLKDGHYRAIVLLEDGRYSKIDSVEVRPNGLNYQRVDSLQLFERDTFSTEVNVQMNRYFSRQQNNPLGEPEKRALYRTYQQQFQYFGEGDVVSGYITDDTGERLPGVTIVIKGTTYGTTTDIDGFYSLKVPSYSSELIISYVGFDTQEIEIGQRNSIDILLSPGVTELQEVVVTGLGVTNRRSLTGSVVTVDRLAGVAAGVQVTSLSGYAGTVAVRGLSSIDAQKPPLIVIDGVPFLGNLNMLDQAELATIQVMKSEAATALYGSRAANGVLLITTKSGIPGISLLNSESTTSDASFFQGASAANSIRNNFSDLAIWEPKLRTDEDGKARFVVTFPDDITKWETFVYAMNSKKQVGQTRTEIKSFKPISAQLSVPRFLVQNDSSVVVGKSLNYTFDLVTVTSSFEVNGEETFSREVTFSDASIDTLKVTPTTLDSLNVKYHLKRDDGYFDGEQRKIPVYPHGLQKKIGHYGTLMDDTVVHWSFSPEHGPVFIYATSNPVDLIKEKIEYLTNYRYECNEQLASKLKALIASKRLQLISEPTNDRRIRRIITRLVNNQNQDGLWGWWNTGSTSLWISVHVVEALGQARDAGYRVSLNYKKLADEAVWNLLSSKSAAAKSEWLYMASVLDLDINRVTFIQELDSAAEFKLEEGLRLLQIKQLNKIKVDVDWLLDSLKTDLFGSSYLTRNNGNFAYAPTDLKLSTMALNVLSNDSILSEHRATSGIRNFLLTHLSESQYINTYTTSNIVEALGKVVRRPGLLEAPAFLISGDYSESVEQFPYAQKLDSIENLTITKKGQMPVYVNAYQERWISSPTKDSTNFLITSTFEGSDDQLSAGKPEKLYANVQLKDDAKYVMIEVPIPASCSYNSKKNYFRGEVHREYYKEKVSIFCENLKRGDHQFEIDLLPRYSGSYMLNPAKIELMYFPVFSANEGVKQVRVE